MITGLWSLIVATDFVTKMVLLILLGMSIVCWALAIYRRMEITTKMKALIKAKGLLHNTKGMDDLLNRLAVIQKTYAGELLATFLGDFKKLLHVHESGQVISDKDWYFLQSSINNRIDEAVAYEESLLPILSTNAAVAPLIGLFGTVWGLIHAFIAIAAQRTADIAAVAPGIAEALITTLAGLLVAIPALALYAYLQSQVRTLEQEIVDLADSTVWIMRGVIRSDSFKTTTIPTKSSVKQETV